MYTSRNASFITEGDKIVGVNLGAEFASEHEDGFNPLHFFGYTDADIGKPLSALGNKKVPEEFRIVIDGERAYLFFCWTSKGFSPGKDWCEMIIGRPESDWSITAAWDDESFGVGVFGEEHVDLLQRLYEAAHKNDLALLFGATDIGALVMGNHGPMLVIISECASAA